MQENPLAPSSEPNTFSEPNTSSETITKSDRPDISISGIRSGDVAHVAKLARLELTDAELEMFTDQLASILDHVRDIALLDLNDTSPTAHPFGVVNALRVDEPVRCLDRDEVLAMAPSIESNRFRVPRIVSETP